MNSDSTKPDVPTAAQEVHKHEANQQQQRMQVQLQVSKALLSTHICRPLCSAVENLHMFFLLLQPDAVSQTIIFLLTHLKSPFKP